MSQGQTKEEALENITNLFKELFRGFVDRGIFRTFLDSTTIWYVIPKVSGYPRELCGKFLDKILYGGIRRKVSVFYPLGVYHPENVGLINIEYCFLFDFVMSYPKVTRLLTSLIFVSICSTIFARSSMAQTGDGLPLDIPFEVLEAQEEEGKNKVIVCNVSDSQDFFVYSSNEDGDTLGNPVQISNQPPGAYEMVWDSDRCMTTFVNSTVTGARNYSDRMWFTVHDRSGREIGHFWISRDPDFSGDVGG